MLTATNPDAFPSAPSTNGALSLPAGLLDIVVSWRTQDALCHVNNAQFFTYFEDERCTRYARIGIRMDSSEVAEGPIMAETTCRFRGALHARPLNPVSQCRPARWGAGVPCRRLFLGCHGNGFFWVAMPTLTARANDLSDLSFYFGFDVVNWHSDTLSRNTPSSQAPSPSRTP